MKHATEHVVSPRAALLRRLFTVYALGVYAFIFAPIAFLVLFSFNASPAGSFPITGLSTRWYSDLFANYELQSAFWTSVRVALEVTALSVVIGTAAAFPLVRARLPFRAGFRIGLTLPIMIPGLLIGVSLLIALTEVFKIDLSAQTAVLGQCLYTTPFVILLVVARLQTFDRAYEWAAGDLGANAVQRLRYVLIPALAPAILAAALLTFTLSFDEFVITRFVIGTDTTLPVYIYNRVRVGATPSINAIASLFLVGSMITLALAVALPALIRGARRWRLARRAMIAR